MINVLFRVSATKFLHKNCEIFSNKFSQVDK